MMDYSNRSYGKTGAVIVLYNPDIPQLVKSLRVLEHSVGLLCLVDNSKENHNTFFKVLRLLSIYRLRKILV